MTRKPELAQNETLFVAPPTGAAEKAVQAILADMARADQKRSQLMRARRQLSPLLITINVPPRVS